MVILPNCSETMVVRYADSRMDRLHRQNRSPSTSTNISGGPTLVDAIEASSARAGGGRRERRDSGDSGISHTSSHYDDTVSPSLDFDHIGDVFVPMGMGMGMGMTMPVPIPHHGVSHLQPPSLPLTLPLPPAQPAKTTWKNTTTQTSTTVTAETKVPRSAPRLQLQPSPTTPPRRCAMFGPLHFLLPTYPVYGAQ